MISVTMTQAQLHAAARWATQLTDEEAARVRIDAPDGPDRLIGVAQGDDFACFTQSGMMQSADGPTPPADVTSVHAVTVAGREDPIYLFASFAEADRFATAVRENGGVCTVTDEPISQNADTLITAERDDA